MITVYHLLVSQSERVIWLFEELGLPYELKSYPRDPVTRRAPPIFQQLHPLGSAPVIQDGAVTMAESLAIFTYILHKYGNGKLQVTPEQPNYADYVYWFHYSNAGLMPQASSLMRMLTETSQDNYLRAAIDERFGRSLRMINDRLAVAPFMAGKEFTAADILMHFPFATLSAFSPIDISPYPHIRAWLDRISLRPTYQKAMKIAGHERDPALA